MALKLARLLSHDLRLLAFPPALPQCLRAGVFSPPIFSAVFRAPSQVPARAFSLPSDPTGGKLVPNEDQNEADKGSRGRKMAIVYTCKVCQTRSSKVFSHRSYHHGIVIVRCDGCASLHLIADNLGWFKGIHGKNVVDILREKGETVKNFSSDGGVALEIDSYSEE